MRVCLMLPATTRDVSALVAAVREQHPEADLLSVWCGAPHDRPQRGSWRWIDERIPAGWRVLAMPSLAYEWWRTAEAVAALDDAGDEQPVLVLRAGSALVTGNLSALGDGGTIVAPRSTTTIPADGLTPSAADLARAGSYSTAVASIAAPDAGIFADEMIGCLAEADVGPAFDRAAVRAGARTTPAGVVVVAGWSPPDTSRVAVIDVSDAEPEPHRTVLFGGRPVRWPVSGDPRLVALLDRHHIQRMCAGRRLELPGGITVDPPMRGLVADAVQRARRREGEWPPDAFDATDRFLAWLAEPGTAWGADIGRYWMAVHASRPDLQLAFPHPEAADADGFRAWTAQRRQYEPDAPAIEPARRNLRPPWTDTSRLPGGVNLIGYLGFDKSLGDVARRVLASLEAAQVPVAALDYHRSGSPPTASPPALGTTLVYDTNLLIINADQQVNVAADYGSILYPGRRTIGYWFWDVAHVPETMLPAFDHVDAVWVATDFTADALRAATDKPVKAMPIPVPMPQRSAATRADLGLPAGRFVFLVTFDHLSVTERKNPLAAIDAFRRAFPQPTDDGPVLIVKSINAAHRPAQHDWLRQAAAGRADVIVTDRHLSRGDQMALVAESDCIVSLHRTEGLGLHLIEAMWFAKPTIATRYSGNLAFMNDANSALIDAVLVPVTHGEGYFPPSAEWADPDLDQAADWMRRIAADPALAAQLGDAGRATMERQPSPAETGRAIATALAAVPIRSAEKPAPPAKNVAMSVKRRVGWMLRGGANERAALEDHAAAIRELQRSVSELTETVARIDRKLAPDDGETRRRLDDIEQRVAQIGEVVAAGTLEPSAAADAGDQRSAGGNGG